MKYLLDANTYIQAKNFYYRMNFCPAYWDWLDQRSANGDIGSTDMVLAELKEGKDELADWVKARQHHFIPVDDEETQANFVLIANYVSDHDIWKEPYISRFLTVADPWLIAKAMATGATVVTHEVLVPANSTKVKIPNICKAFAVPYMDTYTLLEMLQAQFVLE